MVESESQKVARYQAISRKKRHAVRECKQFYAEIGPLVENAPNRVAAASIEAKLESLRVSLIEIANYDEQLVEFLDPKLSADDRIKEEDGIFKEYDELKANYVEGMGKLKFIREVIADPSSSHTGSPRRSFNASFIDATLVNPLIKLQDVPVPIFDGTYQSFPDWYGEFSTVVDKNESFDDFQKLYLLKRSMGEGAKQYVKDIGTDGAVYKLTFQSLYNTFFQRRRIINAHFTDIVDMAVIPNSQLRENIEQVKRSLRGLKVCGIDTDAISPFIAFLMSRKISRKLKDDWLNSNHDWSVYPSFESLAAFLLNRSFIYESSSVPMSNSKFDRSSSQSAGKPASKGAGTKFVPVSVPEKRSFAGVRGQGKRSDTLIPPSCLCCGESHYLDICRLFLSKTVNERFDFVKQKKLCLKCFKCNHAVANCKRLNCRVCDGNHHYLLHREGESKGQVSDSRLTTQDNSQGHLSRSINEGGVASSQTRLSLCSLANDKSVFLSTAVVQVLSPIGKELGRILLDQGSEVTVVTKEFCQRSKLEILPSKYPASLIGINETPVLLAGCAKFVLKSRFSNDSIAIEAEVIAKIPYSVNRNNFKSSVSNISVNMAESLELPYHTVDIMLGSEYVEFIFRENRIFYENLCLRESIFGYVLSGSSKVSSFMVQRFCGLSNLELSERLSRFFDIGVEPEDDRREAICEHALFNDHFERTYQIDKTTNRFMFRLPVKDSVNILNGSFGKVRTMLLNSEKRRKRIHQEIYCKIFQEYEDLGHMTRLQGEMNLDAYFIPHHLVFKKNDPGAARIVFNASYNDASGTSLNSHLLEGPVLQPDLFTHVVRFRQYLVAFAADIFRMYRSILADPVDRKYQHILFRYDFNQPVEEWQLNTLVNGVGPASSIATKCLDKVGEFVEVYDKIASEVIRKHFYMDNGMTGAKSVKDAISIQKAIHAALGTYGFDLCKYQSNSKALLSQIEANLIDKRNVRSLGGEEFVSLLGLLWFTDDDMLGVNLRFDELSGVITKRVMLSDISKIFDILGIFSPVTIRAKILLQELWKEGRQWDEEVSDDLAREFLTFREDLKLLSSYVIDRCYYLTSSLLHKQLIGFSDASIKAYCVIIYVRSVYDDGKVHISFLCSKTRVTPIKTVDIHRLELMAAHLLARLINQVSTVLGISDVFTFCDSQVALGWINIDPYKLKQFVSNRVSQIVSWVSKEKWFYVEGKFNPADLGTRGMLTESFLKNQLWRIGPDWLSSVEEFDSYVSKPYKIVVNKLPELKLDKTCMLVFSYQPISYVLERYSSLNKVFTIIGYWLRYMRIVKARVDCKRDGSSDADSPLDKNRRVLSVGERKQAMYVTIRFVQRKEFAVELECLEKGVEFPRKSRMKSLNVMLDDNGLMRVGGRLENSNLSYDIKHPIILPANCQFVERYVTYIHEKHAHAPRSFVYHHIRSRFWIIGNIFAVFKKVFRLCVPCCKSDAKLCQQFMGNLPKERVSVQRPFSVVGVDLTGAVTIKCTNHRTYKNLKVYLVFFVCFAIRAVHIEIAEDLTTEAFLAALERFSARRGLPRLVYSDNATNFIGAKNVLLDDVTINRFLSENGIEWRTIAPHSPHQGGLWESAVKAGKSYIIKAIGAQVLNLFELTTVVAKVEAILNSRPLCYQRTNEFVSPVSPGHFLIGTDFLEVPVPEARLGTLKARYRLWRQVVDSFWVSWRQNYLNELQVRRKWQTKEPNLQVSDVVLLSDKIVPVLKWPMAIVEEVFPDSSGVVRNVCIRLANGSKRKTSVQKLVYLPINVELD